MFDFAADARAEGGENGMNHKGLVTFDRKYKKDSCNPRTTEENAAKAAAQKGEAVPTESANDGEGDEQFEINDSRSFGTMYKDISNEGLQPVLNDYLYV